MASERKVLITSDSTTDLGPELLELYGIKTFPLNIILGDNNFKDGIDIDPDAIYAYHAEHGILPKTAAINLAEFEDGFKPLIEQGYSIVNFTISSEMSTTYASSCLAGKELGNVYTVDTRNLSTGGGLLVLEAVKMAKEGLSAEEIQKRCTELAPFVDASFVIDSLEYLYKGGRCSALAAFGANLLKLKPLIQVKNGTMGVTKKYRGKYESVLHEYVADKLADKDDIVPDKIFITHAGVDAETVEKIRKQVAETIPFENIYITRASCTVSCHCGRNTLGVLFIRRSPLK